MLKIPEVIITSFIPSINPLMSNSVKFELTPENSCIIVEGMKLVMITSGILSMAGVFTSLVRK